MDRDSATLVAAAPLLRDRAGRATASHRATTSPATATTRAAAVRDGRRAGVEMTVRAEVAAVELPIEQVLALAARRRAAPRRARRRRRDALRRTRCRSTAARPAAAAAGAPSRSSSDSGGGA